MDKTAVTDYPVSELIAKRWSARAFSERPVENEKIMSLFEAARWAASSYNEQPWRFILFTAEDKGRLEDARSILSEGNSYARKAPVLMCVVAKKTLTHNGADNGKYLHDAGAATAYMFLEAYNQGLAMHVMGGFDGQKARQLFEIPEGFDPVTMVAVGYYGDPEQLAEPAKEKEMAARTRRPVSETVFAGMWGKNI
ncbi:nitroreductase family protein [Nitrososphaera sp.]|uniref:nitroreductase family protein n=1 Tax=Nitrososphaera sp. TaxID=1971748 RepID=UPI002EDB1EAC